MDVRGTGGWRSFRGTGTGSGRAARRPWQSKVSLRRGGERGGGRVERGEAFSPAAREKGAEEMCRSLSPAGSFACLSRDFLESAFRSVLPPFGSAFQELVISSSQVPSAVGASLINAGKAKLLTPICVGREISACSSRD